MKLHLGCGDVRLDGWVNVDRRYAPSVDFVDNIGLLHRYKYPQGEVEAIYCCHALDHFDRWTYKSVLRRWHELLRPGGELFISLPDFAFASRRFIETGDVLALTGHLYAAQDYEGNVRHFAWDYRAAERDLREVGFHLVTLFKSFADDASAFEGSLNVVAKKAVEALGRPRGALE